jgi:TetR/AcrR family transcriptional regulator, regulator of cefoperazone and chloramphenicol sensitivity
MAGPAVTQPRPKDSTPPAASVRARATRARVLAAARECIDELGPLGATSNEIARRAGVSWGVIQYHFGSRDAIFLAMITDGFASLLETLDASAPPAASAPDPIALAVDAIWDYCTQPDYLLYMDVLRLLSRDPESRTIVDGVLRETEAQLNRRMARLLKGTITSESTLRTVRQLIFAAMRGLALKRSFDDRTGPSSAERRLLVRALHLAIADAAVGSPDV